MTRRFTCGGLAALALTAIAGCSQQHALVRPADQSAFYGAPDASGVAVEQGAAASLFATELDCGAAAQAYAPRHFRADSIMPGLAAPVSAAAVGAGGIPLSAGDMVEVSIHNGDGFAGSYVINPDGRMVLPVIDPLPAAGRVAADLAEDIELALINARLFRPGLTHVSARVLHWAPVEVTVSGAVFQPGRHLINNASRASVIEERARAYGDFAPTRYLSEALRAASGVRPDAKIDQVVLIRSGWQVEVDLSGVLTGDPVDDVVLVAGDRVIVPTTGCFQRHLVRPSQITPRGFRVFVSNLTETAGSNAEAAVGAFSTNLPYGTRLLQAAVSANCVGGAQWTNAPRKVALASNHPLTGETQVVVRSIEQLLRDAGDEHINPFLMPNDALACYDSDVTNLRDLSQTLFQLLLPFRVL